MKWLCQWLSSPPTALFDDALWESQLARIDGAEAFSSQQVLLWRDFTARFLIDKAISATAGCELSAADSLLIAMLCCQPVLNLGYEQLRGWHEVIVYPGEFGVRRQHLDEDSGVLHEWDETLSGECWEHGPVILSLADSIQAAEAPTSGYHVVVHEIAHKLDLLDGSLNGVPYLPDTKWRARWVADFQDAFDELCMQLEAGDDTLIDPYASEEPGEFFAVVSEYHFTDPELLATHMPKVAAHLSQFYERGCISA